MRSFSIAQRSTSIRRPVSPDRVTRLRDISAPNFGPTKSGLVPSEYQKTGILWLRDHDRALLGDDLGLGKTAQALRALPSNKPRTVVVCPASVAMTWMAEVKKWRPDLSVTTGEELRRPREGEILVISYDSLPNLGEWTTRLTNDPMRDVYLIFDEVQMIKCDDALRTKKARRLRVQCKVCWGLSATPMLGDAEDLWGVLMSLGLTRIFQDSKPAFIELCGGEKRYTKIKGRLRRIGYKWGTVSPVVKERLKEVMLRRLADDVLEQLPERHVIDLPVEAPESLIPFLTKVKEQWDDVDPDEMPPFELLSEAMTALARAKTPAAVEWTDEHASDDQPLLVFSAHLDPIRAVGKLKGAAMITGEDSGPRALRERRKIVDAFQAGKHRILAMTIKTGGAGLNLQRAAGVLFVDRAYTPGDNAQAYGRARRQGNIRARVFCWRMISSHPLDEHLSAILDRKEKQITAAVG